MNTLLLPDGLAGLLADEYMGIGITGKQSIALAWSDFSEGRVDEAYLSDIGITRQEWVAGLVSMTNDIVSNDKLDYEFGSGA